MKTSESSTTRIPIHERFLAFQGEGVHLGQKAFFIRTFGCPVKCPWCDSAGTWHKNYVPKEINRMSVDDLASEVVEANPDFVVLTGGEPMVHQNLTVLSETIRKAGYRVHVETCGAYLQPPVSFDWITLSPKRDKLPLPDMVRCASEFKIIVDTPEAIDYWVDTLRELGGPNVLKVPVWLHPEWSKRADPETLTAITKYVTSKGAPFRAGWQLHKLYKCDSLDNRTAPLAPLGGNPELGY